MATMVAPAPRATSSPPRRMDIAGSEDSVDRTTLGGRMAWSRMRAKMSQKDLAARIPNKDGSAKSRATIVQYEKDKIQPPLDVVELIAKQLKVSPSFIAFGVPTVNGLAHDVELVSIDVISFGKDGQWVSDTIALSKDRLGGLDVERENIIAYVLPHDAKEFDLSAGDIVLCDKSIVAPDRGHDRFAIRTPENMDVIEFDTQFAASARKMVSFTGPRGQKVVNVKLSDLHVLGAVVSTIRK